QTFATRGKASAVEERTGRRPARNGSQTGVNGRTFADNRRSQNEFAHDRAANSRGGRRRRLDHSALRLRSRNRWRRRIKVLLVLSASPHRRQGEIHCRALQTRIHNDPTRCGRNLDCGNQTTKAKCLPFWVTVVKFVCGPSRHFAAAQQFGRFRGKAEINRREGRPAQSRMTRSRSSRGDVGASPVAREY